MRNLFENLLVSSPNGGGLFFSRGGEVFRLDDLDTTGFSYHHDVFFRGIQPNKLCISDSSVTLISGETSNFDDVHDVLWEGNHCYLVGTAGNEIIKITREGVELQRWVFPGDNDSWHINCLEDWNGRLVFSAFGDWREHRGYKGNSGGAGFVQDLLSGERLITGLSQPHSLVAFDDRLFLANSENYELIEFAADGTILRSKKLDGYTRGILIRENTVYVGLSCSRNVQDVKLNSSEIVALDLQSFEELGRISVPSKEIYDIHGLSENDDIAKAVATIGATSSVIWRDILDKKIVLNESLTQMIVETRAKVESLSQDVYERDGQIEKLSLELRERDVQIDHLHRAMSIRHLPRTFVTQLYKFLYQKGGFALRMLLSDQAVSRIKRILPDPSGIPTKLTFRPTILPSSTSAIADIDPATNKPDIFIFSIIDWDFRTQRPQHIARLLAENHRVFYIEMMLEMSGPVVRRISDRLYVIRISRQSIGHIQPYVGCASEIQVTRWISNFLKFCDQVSPTSFKHVVVQHPFWWQMIRHLPPEFYITFDCMDDIAGFSNTTDLMLENELSMIAECDQLVVSSAWLKEKYSELKQSTLIRNGGDLEHFAANVGSAQPPHFLVSRGFSKQSNRIDVGYVGAIAEWFDVDLIRQVALLNPDMEFHLCGGVSTAEAASLESISNVKMYGEISYTDVPAFIDQMDVMTIPFQLLPIIQACDPVKFYEYSAKGKPTVSTRLPELNRADDLLFLSTGVEEFASNLRKAVNKGQSQAYRDALRAYAANNTWRHRSELFEQVLGNFPKVSVIVLSYGDPALTIQTINSLFNNGPTYPNMELILVDNGSCNEALEQIRQMIASLPDGAVRLIENEENLGFARGNNIGIEQATGDYVFLLNNDTYVTPGAIAALVRHLHDNPSIGVVGPMTNNIGNEARVEIDYDNIQDMLFKARQLTIGYRGKYDEMRVAAYFAAMFRRKDFKQFGLLSEEYGLGMFEDDDHCAIIRSKGYICAVAEDAFVHHHLSATFDSMGTERKSKLFENNKKIFENKWGKWVPHRYDENRLKRFSDKTKSNKGL